MDQVLAGFHTSFDNSPVGCCVTEFPAGTKAGEDVFVYANEAFCRMVDAALPDVIGNKSNAFFNEQSEEEHSKIEEIYQKNKSYSFTKFMPNGKVLAVVAYRAEKSLCAFVFYEITHHQEVISDYEKQLRLYRLSEYSGVFKLNIDKDFAIEYANDRFYFLIEYTREQQSSGNIPKKCADFVYEEDIPKLRKQIFDAVKTGQSFLRLFLRIVTASGGIKIMKATTNITAELDGTKHLEGTVIDITEQVKLANEVKESRDSIRQSRDELAVAIKHSGIDMWKYDAAKHTIDYYVPSHYSKQIPMHLDNAPEAFFNSNCIDADSIDDMRQLYKEMEAGVPVSERNIKLSDRYGGSWFKVAFTNKLDENGLPTAAYCTAENIDKTIDTEKQFLTACNSQNLHIWSIDFLSKKAYMSDELVETYGGKRIIDWDSDDDQRANNIYEADKKKYLDYYKTVLNEKISATGRVRSLNIKTGNLDTFNIVITPILDKKGNVIKAVGSAKQINSLVEAEENYNLIKHFSLSLNEGFSTLFRLNLTKNICSHGQASNKRFLVLQESGTFDGFVSKALQYIPFEYDRSRCLEIFSRNDLIKMYASGKRNTMVEFRYCIDGTDVIWVRTRLDMAENPETGDIEAVVYTREINDEKNASIVIDKLIDIDFDFIATCSVRDKKLKVFLRDSKSKTPAYGISEYGKAMRKTLNFYFNKEDAVRIGKNMRFENIISHLEESDIYSVSYATKPINGLVLRKKWDYMYLDSTKSSVLITRSDITETYNALQSQQEALTEALSKAEAASIAKGEFLSRMSHEIRTPMTAIIGMTSIAEQCIDDKETVSDCLKKLDSSSHSLLNLINDILDMSRIESGKTTINIGVINFYNLLSRISDMFQQQAESKGVRFKTETGDFSDRHYYGDETKLQQIIVNLIGNALKFTDNGGKIEFSMHCKAISDSTSTLTFSVSDTGVGMSEEFAQKMFEPFEQEYNGRTSEYGGTGLGLSICKNYVDVMGGTIDVKTALGKGSEFTVTLDLKTAPLNT